MEGIGEKWMGEGASVFDVGDGKVPDGLRYHVLDVWVDGMLKCEDSVNRGLLEPVQKIAKEGKTRTLRTRARAALDDSRLREDRNGGEDVDESFEGFDSD